MFNYTSTDGELKIAKIVGHVLLLLVILSTVFGSFGVINPGELGVKVRLGKVNGVVQGFYLKLPYLDSVHVMDVHTQSLTATKDSPLSAASNDLQDTRLAVTVNYHIDTGTVTNIYQQYGNADIYYQNVVEPLIVSTVKATASQYTAAEQIQKRAEMANKTLIALQAAFEGKNVIIEKADITDVSFSDSFTQAIEDKVTAVQKAETAKNKLEQVKYEAEQTIETAKATAEAQRISSAALAAQGGSDYVALQAINKWDGHYPTTLMGGSTVPLIQLK